MTTFGQSLRLMSFQTTHLNKSMDFNTNSFLCIFLVIKSHVRFLKIRTISVIYGFLHTLLLFR